MKYEYIDLNTETSVEVERTIETRNQPPKFPEETNIQDGRWIRVYTSVSSSKGESWGAGKGNYNSHG